MWKAAKCPYSQAWEREMMKIKDINDEAFKYLIQIALR